MRTLAAAVLVRVVEQVLEDHAQPVAIGQHVHGIDGRGLDLAATRRALAMCEQVADEPRDVDALRPFARIARHGALVRENGLGQVLEPVALDLPELEELGALRFGNAADARGSAAGLSRRPPAS